MPHPDDRALHPLTRAALAAERDLRAGTPPAPDPEAAVDRLCAAADARAGHRPLGAGGWQRARWIDDPSGIRGPATPAASTGTDPREE
jgi:hypothetical protein